MVIVIDSTAGERPALKGEFVYWDTGKPVPEGTAVYSSGLPEDDGLVEAIREQGGYSDWVEAHLA